jgi:hypothetical protein
MRTSELLTDLQGLKKEIEDCKRTSPAFDRMELYRINKGITDLLGKIIHNLRG